MKKIITAVLGVLLCFGSSSAHHAVYAEGEEQTEETPEEIIEEVSEEAEVTEVTEAPAEVPEETEVPAETGAPAEETVIEAEPEALPEEEVLEETEAPAEILTASNSGTCGDSCTWTLSDDGTITISGTGDMKDYSNQELPEWRENSAAITKVVISPGITSVGSHAFGKCENLTSVVLPEGLVSINEHAFDMSSALPEVSLPSSLKTIKESAFYATGIKSIAIPDSVTTIKGAAFGECMNLEYISFPKYVETLPYLVCYKDHALKTVVLPKNLKTIEDAAFRNSCAGDAVTFYMSNSVTKINANAFDFENDNTALTINYAGTKKEWDSIDINYSKDDSFIDHGDGNGILKAEKTVINYTDYLDCVFMEENSKFYWYENNVKQGTYDDPNGVMGDGSVRGREIYDPVTNAWYWLDSCYDGAKAVGKEVWMPYIYQKEGGWTDAEKEAIAKESDPGMEECVLKALKEKTGKWVRYDENGAMLKGWITIGEGTPLAALYPGQKGNTYYYDNRTGLMARGKVTLGGVTYEFDELTGALK